ncbi:mercury(II) reductase [Luteithermobacter gelatinilyticus]|uniref:mercury(II) reductase n=1 Tax=Luteithermobacter gelatinilyticus TaxID=2582913 RepID=UPI0011060633|nr:mercury(II) reductase [Luteithermobacter gelatinilyticus]|tara:strand:+ start:1908 stop:3353 length:1446 start_codon:yes stop_codon:yes gene_type:complete
MVLDKPESSCCVSGSSKAKIRIMVIGAGSAGFSAAITAAEAGADVTLVGEGTIGGTCVNVGCVPSKTMIRAVEILYQAPHAARFHGITSSASVLDWQAVVAHKQQLVEDLRQAKYSDVLSAYPNIRYMEGRAQLGKDGVMVDGKLHTPDKIIIATGSSNRVPSILGIETIDYLDSTSALGLETLPGSMIIIGGGVIGCELGQMFARAGVKVTLCCRSRLLPDMEPEISKALQTYLESEGITVCAGIGYQSVKQHGDGVRLHCKNEGKARMLEADRILLAAGRKPNTAGLGLEEAGVLLTKNGGIEVDAFMRSSNPDIYAAGDVTGKDMFVYMAAYGAKLAAQNAVGGDAQSYNNATMPSVVFTDPQVSSVGLTESQASEQGYSVKTSVITLDHVPRYLAARDTRGLIKLVADKDTDKLLGAHVLAPEGGELIQTAAIALKASMTATELGQTIFPYLTGVEGLKLAAQTFDKDVNTLSCCAG